MSAQRRWMLIGVPYSWLLLFFLIPFVIVMGISLSDPAIAIPPYAPVLDVQQGLAGIWQYFSQLDFENFQMVLEDEVYFTSYLNSLKMSFVTTLLCLLLGYPIAYAIASAPGSWKPNLIMAINLTFWCSFLIRIYAWIVLLSNQGVINQILLALGVIDTPIRILNTDFATYLGLVYAYLPLMIFPIYATLEKLDNSVYEASRDLGCSHIGSFVRVTLPLSRPGILAGCFLVFVPVTGEYIVPSLLGNSSTPVIGRVLWNEFFSNGDWPLAASISVLLMLVLVVPIVLYQFFQNRNAES
ncbi:ABC transporter permease [Oceanobacter mangrovi]|uniref:ABC transporter permease n=1 Tax=Oceanobacter mangrovi TaxID=2862510 RepID=UPI001C8DC8F7|nr:ABC transporter permease [Oceanobacter mangrovi]